MERVSRQFAETNREEVLSRNPAEQYYTVAVAYFGASHVGAPDVA
jgi:hypothetical protein